MHSICAEKFNASQGKEGGPSASRRESLPSPRPTLVIFALSMTDMTTLLTAGFRVAQRYGAGNTAD
jgi:hypothetical protein